MEIDELMPISQRSWCNLICWFLCKLMDVVASNIEEEKQTSKVNLKNHHHCPCVLSSIVKKAKPKS
jgi:hypothetical protein